MLSEWQIFLLDIGQFLLIAGSLVSLMVFPWKHWNSLLGDK